MCNTTLFYLLGVTMNVLNITALPKVTFVIDYINARNQVKVLSWLFEDMQTKWSGLKDTSGNNLVLGVHLAATKTDACKSYATELITRYMTAQGLTLQNWSPESLRSISRDNEGGLAAIGVQDYRTHHDLFEWVLSFVLGIDPMLAKASTVLTRDKEEMEELVLYWTLSKYKFITVDIAFDAKRVLDLNVMRTQYPALSEVVKMNNFDAPTKVLNILFNTDATIINDADADELLCSVLCQVTAPELNAPDNTVHVTIPADEVNPIEAVRLARETYATESVK